MKKKGTHAIIAAISIFLLVLLDQWTKRLATIHLSLAKGGTDIVLWKGVFRLRYLENRGAAFGMMQGQKVILALTTMIVVLFLCWIFFRIPSERHFCALRWLITVVLAGAVGNFIDRMLLGYVVDFFYFELIDFPIFNVADIYVTCSVILFVFLFLFFYKEDDLNRILPVRKKEEENEDTP